jgi:hypothetical protein
MVASLALAFAALRAGISLRRARLARRPPPRGARRRHLLLARPAVALLLAGFLLGPLSAAALRGWTPFATLHGLAGLVAAALFVAAALHGRRLERGRASARGAHALFGALALLVAAVAAMAGFVLLP